jgi:hypothetical protein
MLGEDQSQPKWRTSSIHQEMSKLETDRWNILTLRFLKIEKREMPLLSLLKTNIGAGEGNRTLVSALGRPHSTIEPHPLPCRRTKGRPYL